MKQEWYATAAMCDDWNETNVSWIMSSRLDGHDQKCCETADSQSWARCKCYHAVFSAKRDLSTLGTAVSVTGMDCWMAHSVLVALGFMTGWAAVGWPIKCCSTNSSDLLLVGLALSKVLSNSGW